jgi:hypothetical protein
VTIEERFERIEHVTAGLVEERRKDREEDRQLWRDTQRQISDLAQNTQRQIDQLTQKITDTNHAITRMGERIEAVNQAAVDRDDALGQRLADLVSGIGELLRNGKKPT